MLISINPEQPEGHLIHQAVRLLGKDGLLVVPTDTFYALACDVQSRKAADRMRDLKGLPRNKLFSLLCADLSELGSWAGYLSGSSYRTMRRILPGPYTFIVPASDQVPKLMHSKQRTVGIRVPGCPITLALARELGRPLICTSVDDEQGDPRVDPLELESRFGRSVDAVLDGGILLSEPSTVIDLSGSDPEVIRVGKGDVSLFQ